MASRTPCRLYVILARAAPIGVIFRSGPSKLVQIIKWNTKTDAFEPGQWFKGRIYARRSDLSPSGRFMIYFAARHTGPLYSWTAISKPPFLTALALWPKGDSWDGGGLFETEYSVWLNHFTPQARPSERFGPHPFKIRDNGRPVDFPAIGEDAPIETHRLERDGWRQVQKTETSVTMAKQNPSGIAIEYLRTSSFKEPRRYSLVDPEYGWFPMGRVTWADIDHQGRFVYGRQGRLCSGMFDRKSGEFCETVLHDFNEAAFEPVIAPDWARTY